MTSPDKIPADVLASAMDAAHIVFRDERTGLAAKMTMTPEPLYEAIAGAIMAERERCAKVAENVATYGLKASWWSEQFDNLAAVIRQGQAREGGEP